MNDQDIKRMASDICLSLEKMGTNPRDTACVLATALGFHVGLTSKMGDADFETLVNAVITVMKDAAKIANKK